MPRVTKLGNWLMLGSLSVPYWKAMSRLNRSRMGGAIARTLVTDRPEDIWREFEPTTRDIADISVDGAVRSSGDVIDAAATTLGRHGVVVVSGLFDQAPLDSARAEIDSLRERIDGVLASGYRNGTIDDVLWQVDGSVHAEFAGMAATAGGLVNVRGRDGGADAGMIDVFRADAVAQRLGLSGVSTMIEAMRTSIAQEIVSRLLPTAGAFFHVYRNDSVTRTRMLHIDSMKPFFKAFLYLNDVTETDVGPFTYVPGSHRQPERLQRAIAINAIRRNGKATNIYVSPDDAIRLTGSKGTLIIANQAGVHGGLAQQMGRSRTVLVSRFR